jgi:hypothetical protein
MPVHKQAAFQRSIFMVPSQFPEISQVIVISQESRALIVVAVCSYPVRKQDFPGVPDVVI